MSGAVIWGSAVGDEQTLIDEYNSAGFVSLMFNFKFQTSTHQHDCISNKAHSI